MLIDSSVLVKWFHDVGEPEVAEARLLRDAHQSGAHPCSVLDLAIYEFGNVLLRGLRRSAEEVERSLEDLTTLVGAPLTLEPSWVGPAARLGAAHGLTFSDACWAAAAQQLRVPLVSADRQLLAAGLAESPAQAVSRLGLGRGRRPGR